MMTFADILIYHNLIACCTVDDSCSFICQSIFAEDDLKDIPQYDKRLCTFLIFLSGVCIAHLVDRIALIAQIDQR